MPVEQVCTIVDIWIDPKYIIPAFMVLLSSGLFPILLHKYKLKRERQEKLFDTRKTEYQSYFKTMEEAARLAGQDYDEYLTKTLPEATLKLYQSESSPESLVEYQNTMHDFTKGIIEGFQKATNELVSLRIVCSNELSSLLDDFEGLYQKLMNLQPVMLEEIRDSMSTDSFITGNFSFDTPTKLEMVSVGSDLVTVRNDIINTMRRELGYES